MVPSKSIDHVEDNVMLISVVDNPQIEVEDDIISISEIKREVVDVIC